MVRVAVAEFEEVCQRLALLEGDDAHGVLLVVERIGGDQRIDQFDLGIGQQCAAFGDFAVFFLAPGHGHGDGASVLVAAERDDHAAAPVAHALAIQGEAAGGAQRSARHTFKCVEGLGNTGDARVQIIQRNGGISA